MIRRNHGHTQYIENILLTKVFDTKTKILLYVILYIWLLLTLQYLQVFF